MLLGLVDHLLDLEPHQPLRHLEVIELQQLLHDPVVQISLQGLFLLLLKFLANRLPQVIDRLVLPIDITGKLVIEFRFDPFLDITDIDLELHGLTGKEWIGIVRGKLDLVQGLVALFHADQFFLELLAQPARAHVHGVILVTDLLHRLAIVKTLEIDNGDVVHGDAMIRISRAQHRMLPPQPLQLLAHLLVGDLGYRPLDLEPLVRTDLEHGLDIDHGHIGKGAAVVEPVLGDLGMDHRVQPLLFHGVEIGLLDQLLAHLGLHLFPVILLKHGPRHLAPAKAFELYLFLDFIIRLVQGLAHLFLWQGDG